MRNIQPEDIGINDIFRLNSNGKLMEFYIQQKSAEKNLNGDVGGSFSGLLSSHNNKRVGSQEKSCVD